MCRFRLQGRVRRHATKRFPCARCEFSKRNRVGIGVVPPVDPNNQDTSVLIGSEDISKLDLYSEGDPRVLELNGAFNVGNRGMVRVHRGLQERDRVPPRHDHGDPGEGRPGAGPARHGLRRHVIVAHSNEAEWQKFKADHTNEAILDRIVVVKVPYNLRLSEEVKIYQKIIRHSDFHAHVAPHTLEVASMFAILSRLEPTAKCDLMTKLKLYNGEEVVEKGRTKKIDVHELREDDQARGHERHLDALHHEGAGQRAVRQRRRQLHQPDQRPRGADQHGEGGRSARRHAQAVPRVPAGHPAQGVPRDAREGDHQGLRLLLPGAGRVAVPELPRPRRGLRQQDARSRTATPGKSCSPTRASSSRSRSRSRSSARPPTASARR